MSITYVDHVEEINPGDAFYMTPGGSPKALAGTEFVMFSPKDEMAALEAHLASVMQRMQTAEAE
jgi:hypothetical protein